MRTNWRGGMEWSWWGKWVSLVEPLVQRQGLEPCYQWGLGDSRRRNLTHDGSSPPGDRRDRWSCGVQWWCSVKEASVSLRNVERLEQPFLKLLTAYHALSTYCPKTPDHLVFSFMNSISGVDPSFKEGVGKFNSAWKGLSAQLTKWLRDQPLTCTCSEERISGSPIHPEVNWVKGGGVSQTHSLISKISHICQEIHDITERTKPKSIDKANKYNSTHFGQGDKKDLNYTWRSDSSNSVKEGSNGRDCLGDLLCSQYTISPCTQQSPQLIMSCFSSSLPDSITFWKQSIASWRPTSLSSLQNRDIDSLCHKCSHSSQRYHTYVKKFVKKKEGTNPNPLKSPITSQIWVLTSKITQTCQDICDIKLRCLLVTVRKLDLLYLCFSLNFYFLMFLSQFPSMFLLLTYSHHSFPFLPITRDTQDKGETRFWFN